MHHTPGHAGHGLQPGTALVYVLETPQTVTLVASALSVSAVADEPVVLSAQRQTAGQ